MGKKQNQLGNAKVFANRGIERNKKPLSNIVYKIEVSQLKEGVDFEKYSKYKFKDQGYLILFWKYQGMDKNMWIFHDFITPDELKEKLGAKQWFKFCGQGKREFVIQRRIDGKNIKKV